MRISTTTAAGCLALIITACGGSAPASDAAEPDPTPAAAATGSAEPADGGDAGSGSGDSGGAAQDYCLSSTDDLSAALGVEVATAEGFANEGMGGGCIYYTADGTSAFAISVLDSAGAAEAFDSYRQYEGAEDLSGIGDAALFLPLNDMVGVAFRKGDVVASLGPTMALDKSGDDLRAAVESLARQAADGL